MGQIKNTCMEDDGLKDYLNERIESGDLNSIQVGIAKIVIDKGPEVLSEKQRYHYDNFIIVETETADCYRCQCSFPSSEIYENDGMCSWCAHRSERD